jgi:hypothetical protein
VKPGDLVIVSPEYRIPHPVIVIRFDPPPLGWLVVMTPAGERKVNPEHAEVISETR